MKPKNEKTAEAIERQELVKDYETMFDEMRFVMNFSIRCQVWNKTLSEISQYFEVNAKFCSVDCS